MAELLSVRAVEEIVAVGDAKAAPEPTVRAPRAKPAEEPALRHLADLSLTASRPGQGGLRPSQGRIVVEFATMDDLERIITPMAPGSMQLVEE